MYGVSIQVNPLLVLGILSHMVSSASSLHMLHLCVKSKDTA
jgi:hypothetical protein